MSVEFCVITEVPNPESTGNLANTLDLFQITGIPPDDVAVRLPFNFMLSVRTPVFILGEILLVDDSGREVCGAGRKPSKWSVGYQVFSDLADAVSVAKEVQDVRSDDGE